MAKQIRFTKREFLEAYQDNDEKDFLLVLRYLKAGKIKRIEEITGDSHSHRGSPGRAGD